MIYNKTLLLVMALLAGFTFPFAEKYSIIIQYLIMIMLFLSFFDADFGWLSFEPHIFRVLLLNILIPTVFYIILLPINKELAVIAFITAITPTATAAPVMISLLGGRVDYMIASVLLTNTFIALIIPFILPFIIEDTVKVSTLPILKSVIMVIIIPLLAALVIKNKYPSSIKYIQKTKSISFYIWILILFLVMSKATFFIKNEFTGSLSYLIVIGLISLIICIINFSLGGWIGGKKFKKESSQALGQKNTMLTIWLSISFISPLVALGPTFYVIFHNLYNSYQLSKLKNKTY